MSVVAILGAGPIGSAIADRLAQRARVREVRLIDPHASVAEGKALDILQAGAIVGSDTRVVAMSDPLAAASAAAIVVADTATEGEWQGERGVALLRALVTAGTSAPLVFAGPQQTSLMESCYRDLDVKPRRMVGTAASALASAVRAVTAMELKLSDVEVGVVGRPPSFVIGWSAAVCAGSFVRDRVPAHRLLAISEATPRLWPPGPYAIGAATARVVEALLFGSRHLHHATTVLDGELGVRGSAVMLPLELGRSLVLSHVMPSLSPQEQTELMNGLCERT